MPRSVGIALDGAAGTVYPAPTMGLFDFIKSKLSPIDTNKLFEGAKEDVVRRAAAEIGQMAEDQAKEKLSEIATEEVDKQFKAMLGDKADQIPAAVKDPIIEKTSEKIVDATWDSVKDRIAQSA